VHSVAEPMQKPPQWGGFSKTGQDYRRCFFFGFAFFALPFFIAFRFFAM